MRVAGLLIASLALAGGSAMAQRQAAPAPHDAYGMVTGRVTCGDTNLPARLATVTLQTINVKPLPTSPPTAPGSQEKMTRSYQTGMDGSFTIPKVTPGTYYVLIQSPGYMSPITQFTRSELTQPTPETLAKIVKAVPTVTVEADHTATIETRIERGAELSGTIRYDDGSPAGGMPVGVLTKETQAGKDVWVSKRHGGSTDDLGHYRVTGLPPGEYLLEVNLYMTDNYGSYVLSGSGNSLMLTRYSLSFYSGDVARKDRGKLLKLGEGEQRAAADLTIPVSKLHRVVGTLTEQRSGHVVNAGTVTLKYSDGTELAKTQVDGDDSMFHFDYVPEGEYTLSVTNAREIIRESEPLVPNVTPMPGVMKETPLHFYGDTSQPLTVQSEVSGLTVPVPPRTAKAGAAAQ